MKCVRIIKGLTKFDPGCSGQKTRHAASLSPLCARQKNRNNAETPVAFAHALINRGPHLFILPGADTAGTDEDGASFRFGQRLFNCWLPWLARNQMPFVQPGLYPFLREPAGQFLDRRFIPAAMRKKDLEGHLDKRGFSLTRSRR